MNEELDNLSFSFFKIFAQYESTLKERGFFVAVGNKIIVDWDRFANETIGNNFIEDLGELKKHAEYILEFPPKRQSVDDNGKIVWVDVPNTDKSVQSLFGHISRMRNNLYHGAKFNGTWFDPARSKDLLQAGFFLLQHYKEQIDN